MNMMINYYVGIKLRCMLKCLRRRTGHDLQIVAMKATTRLLYFSSKQNEDQMIDWYAFIYGLACIEYV